MNEKIYEAAHRAEKILSSISCEFAEIRLSSGLTTGISLSDKNIDSITSGESVAGSIRILLRGAWGFVTFNDFSLLEKNIKRAFDAASVINSKDKIVLDKRNPIRENFLIDMESDFRDISMEEKFALIEGYNKILRKHDKVQTTRAVYRESSALYAYLNTEGSRLVFDRPYCGVSFTTIAKEGSLIQPFHDSISGFGGYEVVKDKEDMAERVVKISVDMLSARPVDGGSYNVILDPKLSGVFIHEAFGHLSEADFIYENPKMKEMMVLGRKIGPETLNVVDSGDMPELSGYIPFDDEGVIPEKTMLIEGGLLSGRLHSRETSHKMGEAPTGNGRSINVMREPIVRMTNTYIENGSFTKDEIFEDVEDGIYAVDVIGGQTNLEMFTFSSAYAYRVKNGKLVEMLRDVILSGNVFSTLGNIKKIGNDRQMFGGLGGCGKGGQSPLPVSFGGPHILIKDVLIGGEQ